MLAGGLHCQLENGEREGVTVRGRFGWAMGLIGTGPVWPFSSLLLSFFFFFFFLFILF
jgi:hypothetical protein